MSSLENMAKIERIPFALEKGFVFDYDEIITKIRQKPIVINCLNPNDLDDRIIDGIFKLEECNGYEYDWNIYINNLFNNILVKDSCVYNYLLLKFYTFFNKLPDNIVFNQELVNELVMLDPSFVSRLINNKEYEYLTDFVLEVFVASGTIDRFKLIPNELLSEKLILLALSKNDKIIKKIKFDDINDIMKAAEEKHEDGDKKLYNNTLEKIKIITHTIKEQEKLEVECGCSVGMAPILKRYFSSPDSSIISFCKNHYISLSLFEKYMGILKNLSNDINYLYNKLNNIHSDEGISYINEVINSLNESIINGVRSFEKDENIKLNAALFFLNYYIDYEKLINLLKRSGNEVLAKKVKKIVYPAINGFDFDMFLKTKISFVDGEITNNEKMDVKYFMIRHNIPLKSSLAQQVLLLSKQGHISLDKTYPKSLCYELDEEKRAVIADKVNTINFQNLLISNYNELISEKKSARKQLIKDW